MVGQVVHHSRYGRGIIKVYVPPYMEILFENEGIKKRFAYPRSFESFLCFENPEMQREAETAVEGLHRNDLRRIEARTITIRERENALLEARRAELKAKRAAAAKKAAGTRAAKRQSSSKD